MVKSARSIRGQGADPNHGPKQLSIRGSDLALRENHKPDLALRNPRVAIGRLRFRDSFRRTRENLERMRFMGGLKYRGQMLKQRFGRIFGLSGGSFAGFSLCRRGLRLELCEVAFL